MTTYNVTPKLLSEEQNDRMSTISSLENISHGEKLITLFSSHQPNDSIDYRQYVALNPHVMKTYSRLQVSDLNAKINIIKAKQQRIVESNIGINITSDAENDGIVKSFESHGLIVSVQDVDFIRKLYLQGNEALYNKGDQSKPWNLLSTSVIGKYECATLYGGENTFGILGINNIVINLAWSQTPGGVNKATSQMTEIDDFNDKPRVTTYHNGVQVKLRDRLYNKNGEVRTPIEVIASITSKNLSKVIDTSDISPLSEQKVGLTSAHSIEAIGIQPYITKAITDAIKHHILNQTDESKDALMQTITECPYVQVQIESIQMKMYEKINKQLPIYAYIVDKIDGKLVEIFILLAKGTNDPFMLETK